MKITTFRRMPSKQKIMFFINYFLCGIARAAILLFTYPSLSPYFGNSTRMLKVSTLLSEEQTRQAKIISQSIKLAARYTPWYSNCLTQAMVAKFWCTYYNIPYMFFIGYAKESTKPLGEDAHAWVTAGSITITGGQSFSQHHIIMSYSNLKIEDANHRKKINSPSDMKPITYYTINPNADYFLINNEAVVMGKADENLFRMNNVGAEILQLLESKPMTTQMICDYLLQEFDIDETPCMEATKDFIRILLEQNLIRIN